MNNYDLRKIWCWNNGEFKSLSQATVSIMDRGFLFGDGVYEVIPCYNRLPFLFSEHIERLYSSLEKIHLKIGYSKSDISEICSQVLDRNSDYSDQYIYIQATRGSQPFRNPLFPPSPTPNVIVWSYPWEKPQKPSTATQGITLITLEESRWKYCEIKSINLLPNILARNYAIENNADDVVFFNQGSMVECTSSNIFCIKNDQLITSPNNPSMLPGITRSFIMTLAKSTGLKICERDDISREDLLSSDEVFISSSLKEIERVSIINDTSLPVISNSWSVKMQNKFQEVYKEYCGFTV